MKLFHSPGSCSLGILVLLEEIGVPFDLEVVDLKSGAHRQPAYLSRNPKGKVPALERPDGTVLTEFPVIAYWLAKSFPEAGMLPEGLDAEVAVMEMMEHIVSGLHMRGTVFAMVPQKFIPDADGQQTLAQYGRGVVREGFDTLEAQLADQDYLFGAFSVADCAAFYLLSWAGRVQVELPPKLAAYYDRLCARPSVQQALAKNAG